MFMTKNVLKLWAFFLTRAFFLLDELGILDIFHQDFLEINEEVQWPL